MKTAVINIKTDPKLKSNASKLAKEVGLNLSQVIHISLANFVQAGSITASKTFQMTTALEKSLGQIEQDAKTGKNFSQAFNNAKDAVGWLKNKNRKWS